MKRKAYALYLGGKLDEVFLRRPYTVNALSLATPAFMRKGDEDYIVRCTVTLDAPKKRKEKRK